MMIEVAGIQYKNFVSANVTLNLDALSNTFSFEATAKDAKPLPFVGGEACKVFVDGELVITGAIELVNAEGDESSHRIDIQGRDKTGDILDSTLGVLSDIIAPITLKRICEIVVGHLGVDIKVIDDVSPPRFEKAFDSIAPEPGVNAFSFLENLARKKQVLLTSDKDGNLVITRAENVELGAYLQNQVGDPNLANNILSYQVAYDMTGRYNLYRSISQLDLVSASGSGGVSSASSLVNQGELAIARDDVIRKGRQFILVNESLFSGSQDVDRVKWEQKIREARGRVDTATVEEFRDSLNQVWKLNTLVQIKDDPAGINARMLLNTIEFNMDEDEGRTTRLTFVERDAYSLALREPVAEEFGLGLSQ